MGQPVARGYYNSVNANRAGGGGGGATNVGENGKYFDQNVLERTAAGGAGVDLSHLFGETVGDNGWFGGGGGGGARSNQSFGGTVKGAIPSKGAAVRAVTVGLECPMDLTHRMPPMPWPIPVVVAVVPVVKAIWGRHRKRRVGRGDHSLRGGY